MSSLPDNLRRAINYLTLEQEFWAALLFELPLVEVTPDSHPHIIATTNQEFTMGTDGQRIYWSRKFVESLPYPMVAFALAHEVCHPMLLHFTRLYEHAISGNDWTPKPDSQGRLISRDPHIFNIAGDFIINDMLKSTFTVWPGAYLDPKYDSKTWTTEQVYNDLIKDAKRIKLTFVGGLGRDLIEPSSEVDLSSLSEEWKQRVIRAAAVVRSQGRLPASIEALVREYSEPQYPVWLLLERYVDAVLHSDDYSWHRPHPHFLPHGIILPSAYSERVSRVDLWYDTSGSVPDESLSRFHRIAGDIIRNAAPITTAIGQCDAGVHSYAEFSQGQNWTSEIRITGRGGTSFVPPFDYLASHHITPSLLIYLTDLQGTFPSIPPPFPVLWVSTTPNSAPFGTTLHI